MSREPCYLLRMMDKENPSVTLGLSRCALITKSCSMKSIAISCPVQNPHRFPSHLVAKQVTNYCTLWVGATPVSVITGVMLCKAIDFARTVFNRQLNSNQKLYTRVCTSIYTHTHTHIIITMKIKHSALNTSTINTSPGYYYTTHFNWLKLHCHLVVWIF